MIDITADRLTNSCNSQRDRNKYENGKERTKKRRAERRGGRELTQFCGYVEAGPKNFLTSFLVTNSYLLLSSGPVPIRLSTVSKYATPVVAVAVRELPLTINAHFVTL